MIICSAIDIVADLLLFPYVIIVCFRSMYRYAISHASIAWIDSTFVDIVRAGCIRVMLTTSCSIHVSRAKATQRRSRCRVSGARSMHRIHLHGIVRARHRSQMMNLSSSSLMPSIDASRAASCIIIVTASSHRIASHNITSSRRSV